MNNTIPGTGTNRHCVNIVEFKFEFKLEGNDDVALFKSVCFSVLSAMPRRGDLQGRGPDEVRVSHAR